MISRFRQPQPARWLQLVVLLLAVVQVVAPTFHTCEQGGHCPCTVTVNGAQQLLAVPACCRHKLHAVSGSKSGAAIDQSSEESPFSGTCLAQLLQSMPGSLYYRTSLVLLAVPRAAPCPTPEQTPLTVASRREPSRGPPSFTI